MNHDEDQELLAAEYVLGTLDADERAQAQALLGINPAFAAVVKHWERRLGELHLMVETVEPSDEVWQRIRSTISAPAMAAAVPGAAPPVVPVARAAGEGVPPAARTANVVDINRRVRRWQGVSAVASALAATLALFVVTLALAPDRLPQALRPGGLQAPAGRFVAVLQQD